MRHLPLLGESIACNTRVVAPSTFHDFVSPDAEIGEGILDVVNVLEKHGWYPHSLFGSSGIRYWPENGRSRQLVITYKQFVVRQRLQLWAEHTGISELLEITQEEKVEKK